MNTDLTVEMTSQKDMAIYPINEERQKIDYRKSFSRFDPTAAPGQAEHQEEPSLKEGELETYPLVDIDDTLSHELVPTPKLSNRDQEAETQLTVLSNTLTDFSSSSTNLHSTE